MKLDFKTHVYILLIVSRTINQIVLVEFLELI